MKNVINWFEIPVKNFATAKSFYQTVLNAPLTDSPNPTIQYAFLPIDQNQGGIGGALIQAENNEPSMNGTTVYLNGGNDLSDSLSRVEAAGGKIILPKTEIGGGMGFMALFIDSEGNKVGLHSME